MIGHRDDNTKAGSRLKSIVKWYWRHRESEVAGINRQSEYGEAGVLAFSRDICFFEDKRCHGCAWFCSVGPRCRLMKCLYKKPGRLDPQRGQAKSLEKRVPIASLFLCHISGLYACTFVISRKYYVIILHKLAK